jgi:hypothetical protein
MRNGRHAGVLPYLALVWALPGRACVVLEGDRILGQDLTAAKPEFATLNPSVEIGFAPRPGVTRVFPPEELVVLARKFGIPVKGIISSACFVAAPTGVAVAEPPKRALAGLDVHRGERVSVEVTSGAAVLRLQADAESAGRAGDAVLIRNPESGKIFQARVEGKGKVVVQK